MPFELLATAIRYAMMIYAGKLLHAGYIDESMVEPLQGLVVAFAAIVWFWLGKWRPSRFNPDGDR